MESLAALTAQNVTALAASVAAFGVLVAIIQLSFNYRQARTSFEDDLAREYREIMKALPDDAFYKTGVYRPRELTPAELRWFYLYFDLTNDQLFLAKRKRVGKRTAENWRVGMKGNLELPAFLQAWDQLADQMHEDFFRQVAAIVHEVKREQAARSTAA